jgi:hypothetical protein
MNDKIPRSPRLPFVAVAEIAYRDSGGRLVSTLSFHGCYVEAPNTLATGSEVAIKMFSESECVVATAELSMSCQTRRWDLRSRKCH